MIKNHKLGVRNILAGALSAVMVLTSCPTTALATDEVFLDELVVSEQTELAASSVDEAAVPDLEEAEEDALLSSDSEDELLSEETETEAEEDAADESGLIIDGDNSSDISLQDGIEADTEPAETVEIAQEEDAVEEVAQDEETVAETVEETVEETEEVLKAASEDDSLVEDTGLTAAAVEEEEYSAAGKRSFFYTNFTAELSNVTVKVAASNLFVGRGATMKAQVISADEYLEKIEAQNYGKVLVGARAIELTFYDAKGKEFTPIGLSISVEAKKADAESYALYRVNGSSVRKVGTSVKPAFDFYTSFAETYVLAGLKKDDVLRAEGKRAGGKTTFALEEGDTKINVAAPNGAFYGSISMKAEAVSADIVKDKVKSVLGEDAATAEITAYDISFHSGSAEDVEPNKEVTVTINTPINLENNNKLIHIPDEGEGEPTEVTNAVFTENGVTFTSKDFSVYAVVEGETGETVTYRRTYKFTTDGYTRFDFYNKAGDKVDQQIIKKGDTLEEVGVPYRTNKTFENWIVTESDDDAVPVNTTITLPVSVNDTLTKNTTVTLKPAFGNVYYVTFHETTLPADPDIILTKKIVAEGEDVIIGDTIAPQPDDTHIFFGWGTDSSGISDDFVPVYDENDNLDLDAVYPTITDNTDLYPHFVTGNWLRFVSGETGSRASYVPAQFVLSDEVLTTLPVSTRNGYTFAGWYTGSQDTTTGKITYDSQVTDGDGNVINPSSGLVVSSETILYGKWTANNNSSYKVIIWRQKVTDDKDTADVLKKYDYAESEIRYDSTGKEVTSSEEDQSHSGLDYTGFHYARTVQTSETVQADGSTVINVYYDRDLMAVNFYYQVGNAPSGAGTAYIYTPTTSDNGTQYGLMKDGSYIKLDRDNGTTQTIVYYTYGRRQYLYTGTFYTRSYSGIWPFGEYVYTATEYNGNNLPPANDNTTYYTNDERELTRRTQSSTSYGWSYTIDGVTYPYIETRYTRETLNNYRLVTWTGLYGQSFSQNGYTWPSTREWNIARTGYGTVQSFLTAFDRDSNPYNLYDRGSTDSYKIYHYKQALDGNYYETEGVDRYTANGNGGTFTFQNKFTGFTVKSYNTGNNGYSKTGGRTAADSDHHPDDYPLHVYHERNKWGITYMSTRTESDVQLADVYTTGKTIYYEAPLTDYDLSLEQVGLTEREHYTFTGWYADETCTQLYDFETGTMPNSEVVVYAGWEPKWYQIIVDPDGGVITQDIGSTYFWKKYHDNEKVNRYEIRRPYIEDPNGTYKYVYVAGENDPDGDIDVRTATYVTAEAGYTGTKYRQITADDPQYILVGWYVVDPETDETTETPYDFNADIVGPLKIRAVWRLTGDYGLQYNPTMPISETENVSGTFTQSNPDARYADGAEIVVDAPPTNVTDQYVFDGWEIIDPETGATLDNNEGKYYKPGEAFVLDAAAWSRHREVYLRAHYTFVEQSSDPMEITKLVLDGNADDAVTSIADKSKYIREFGDPIDVSVSDNVVTYNPLHMNEAFDLSKVKDKFTRPDYELIGWSTNKNADEPEFGLTDIVGMDNRSDEANTLYAVWTGTFQVYYTGRPVSTEKGNENPKKVRMCDLNGGTYNLLGSSAGSYDRLTVNTLYGGYYKNLADSFDKFAYSNGAGIYDGTNINWTAVQPEETDASAITPVRGVTYYVKEVPKDTYLRPWLEYSYTYANMDLVDQWFITDLDDWFYKEYGFDIIVTTANGSKKHTAKVAKSLTITANHTGNKDKITPSKINESATGEKNRIAYWKDAYHEYLNSNVSSLTVTQYWVTPDGYKVTGANSRTVEYNDRTKTNLNMTTDESVASTILYQN